MRFKQWMLVKGLTILAGMALMVTTVIENRMCVMHLHQDKLPETAKKLRKF